MKLSPFYSFCRFLLSTVLLFLASVSVHANTDPPTWLDVQNYGADPTCTSDSGPAINSAITAASAPGQVIFFPKGCYLIKTQIVDANATYGLAYLGFGRVELSAGTGLTGSIIKFGSGSNAVVGRRIYDLYFECNSLAGIDGIDIQAMRSTEFINVEIRDCAAYGINEVGSINETTVFEGGGIVAYDAAASGVLLSYDANNWTFKGTKFIQFASSPTGVGLLIEGAGTSCIGCDVAGWATGITIGVMGSNRGAYGTEISGGYFENNSQHQIQVGYYTSTTQKAYGVAIHGAYFNATSSLVPSYCIDLEQVDGYSIFGNEFLNCKTANMYAHPDINTTGDYEGADNGTIGPNHTDGSAPDLYPNYGTNILHISGGQITQLNSKSNCSSSVNPAACASDNTGSVAIAAGSTSVTVDTTAVTANSQILVTFDASLGSKLGVTCNTAFAAPFITARTAGTSFTIGVSTAPSAHPACYSFSIIN